MKTPDSSLKRPASTEAERAARLMAAALNPSPLTTPAFSWEPPTLELVAEWFPDYHVKALIGRGAMGAVFRAMQKKLERPVAIKLLPPEIAAREGTAARFEREAQSMAKLSHQNIVAMHDYGQTAEGHLFIVMEYVEGADLSRIIHAEKGGLNVPQALEIVGQICDALQYAHARGFVHRDIKPANVLVDPEGRVKIADFGLAKLLDSGSVASGKLADPLTMTGTVLGTPDYTAPEQLKCGIVDHRADIYSLGVMFYEMLTGDLPRGAWDLPSQRVPTASPRLDEVVNRAMQAEPANRYQQASEVKEAVEGASPLADRPAHPAPRKTSRRLVAPTLLGLLGFLLGAEFVQWKLGSLWKRENPPIGPVAGQSPVPAAVPVAEPSERARQDMNALIGELADAQDALAHELKGWGTTQYWSGPDQDRSQTHFENLRTKFQIAIASGFPPQHPLAKEATSRLALSESAHRKAQLPNIPAGKCLNPNWRLGSAYPDLFDGSEIIPGLRPLVWTGGGKPWTFLVEPAEEPAPVPDPTGDLQDFPEFWPLQVPLRRPTLPLSSPHTQDEADWVMQHFPEATGADSPGLVLAEFDPATNPQLDWIYWSRHRDDLIPWADGQPIAAPADAPKGWLLLKQGSCSVVFDAAPRPPLCGGNQVEAPGWALHTFLWSRIGLTGRCLSGEIPEADLAWPANMTSISSRFGDSCAPECAVYNPEAAKSHAPWQQMEREMINLSLLREMQAGTNTGASIPFHHWPDRRLLVTNILCSRERAEMIAQHHGARLPTPAGQDELDALAQLLPDELMAHCAPLPLEQSVSIRFWNGSRDTGSPIDGSLASLIPDGHSLTVFRHKGKGHLMGVPSRALLVLELPNSR